MNHLIVGKQYKGTADNAMKGIIVRVLKVLRVGSGDLDFSVHLYVTKFTSEWRKLSYTYTISLPLTTLLTQFEEI